jgi:hypothetical protein
MEDVRNFVGIASLYRRFVPEFAKIAKPLTELIRKDVHIKWEGKKQAAFEKLKEAICSDQVLTYPDFGTFYPHYGCPQGGSGSYLVTDTRRSRTPRPVR